MFELSALIVTLLLFAVAAAGACVVLVAFAISDVVYSLAARTNIERTNQPASTQFKTAHFISVLLLSTK